MDRRWKSLKAQMVDFGIQRKEILTVESLDKAKPRKDLFSRLVGALDEEAKVGLTLQEVVSIENFFSLLWYEHRIAF